jgi:hypothetical protein
MDTKVDMTYSFLWDTDPTDEQLQVIMEEVAEEARLGHEKMAKQVIENIERAYIRAVSMRRSQQQ